MTNKDGAETSRNTKREAVPITIALCADPAGVSAVQAQTMLVEIAATIRELSRKELDSRLALGRLLVEVQDRTLWREMRPTYATWSDFLEEGFPKITGLQTRTAYGAMELAKSRTLRDMTPEDRAQIPLSNARTLVRLEKTDPRGLLAAETIQKAKNLSNAEFRSEIGASKGYVVRVWVSDRPAGRQIQRIAENFRHTTEDAARAFADFLESDDIGKRTGDGIDNKIDLIMSTCMHDWETEEAELEFEQSGLQGLTMVSAEDLKAADIEGVLPSPGAED